MAPVGLVQEAEELFSRGIPPSVVENAIKCGIKSVGNTEKEIFHTFDNIRVITNLEETKVITVIKIKK